MQLKLFYLGINYGDESLDFYVGINSPQGCYQQSYHGVPDGIYYHAHNTKSKEKYSLMDRTLEKMVRETK